VKFLAKRSGFRLTDQPKAHTASTMPTKTRTQRDPKRDELRRLGERVREHRRTRGLTQEALAEALELSVAYVSLIERGGRNPPYTTVVAIARALGIPTARIVSEE
jgi:ribosome-binding protein aMBF1 (putative translation factor)